MDTLKKFSKSDLDFLLKALDQNVCPIENMTRNYYFQAVKYALSGIDASVLRPDIKQITQLRVQDKAVREGLNPNIFMSDDVMAYNKYTTGWVGDAIDNFGTIAKPDCPIEFRKWFDAYAYNGGHPFEIYPYVCLYVLQKGDKFYLELSDFGIGDVCPSENVIKMFLALQRAKVSVSMRDKDLLLQKIQKYNLINR